MPEELYDQRTDAKRELPPEGPKSASASTGPGPVTGRRFAQRQQAATVSPSRTAGEKRRQSPDRDPSKPRRFRSLRRKLTLGVRALIVQLLRHESAQALDLMFPKNRFA